MTEPTITPGPNLAAHQDPLPAPWPQFTACPDCGGQLPDVRAETLDGGEVAYTCPWCAFRWPAAAAGTAEAARAQAAANRWNSRRPPRGP